MPKLFNVAETNVHDPQQTDNLPRTRDGQYKRRLTMEEKLLILDPTADPNDTYDRVLAFKNIFAFRVSDTIMTRRDGQALSIEGDKDVASLTDQESVLEVGFARHATKSTRVCTISGIGEG